MTNRIQSKSSFTASTLRRLQGKVALVTGADTGIGSAAATAFAREGADIAVVYRADQGKAMDTRRQIEQQGCRCLAIAGDLADRQFCDDAVYRTVKVFGQLDIVANNVTVQCPAWTLEFSHAEYMEQILRTGIFALFQMANAGQRYVTDSNAIISTLSVAVRRNDPYGLHGEVAADAKDALTRSLTGTSFGLHMLPLEADCAPHAIAGSGDMVSDTEQTDEIVLSCMLLAAGDGSWMTGHILS